MMTACLASVNQREQPCHAGTVQALGGFSAIDDDVEQLGIVDDDHGDLRPRQEAPGRKPGLLQRVYTDIVWYW